MDWPSAEVLSVGRTADSRKAAFPRLIGRKREVKPNATDKFANY